MDLQSEHSPWAERVSVASQLLSPRFGGGDSSPFGTWRAFEVILRGVGVSGQDEGAGVSLYHRALLNVQDLLDQAAGRLLDVGVLLWQEKKNTRKKIVYLLCFNSGTQTPKDLKDLQLYMYLPEAHQVTLSTSSWSFWTKWGCCTTFWEKWFIASESSIIRGSLSCFLFQKCFSFNTRTSENWWFILVSSPLKPFAFQAAS